MGHNKDLFDQTENDEAGQALYFGNQDDGMQNKFQLLCERSW